MKEQEYDHPRFTVGDRDSDVTIYDDEFHWDALLEIYGDFANKSDKVRYAQAICDVLNDNLPRIPRE